MSETKINIISSIPVLFLLGAVLTVLKVLGKITLAWKWLLAPFWIPALLGLSIFGICLVVLLVAAVIAFLE